MSRSQIRRIATAVLVALFGLSSTTALGFWQYSRAHRDDISQQVLAAPAVPAQSLVKPGEYVPEAAFGHSVTVAGDLRSDLLLGSCGHPQSGRAGCWQIAPVVPAGGGAAVVVVLGWFPEASFAAQLSTLRERGVQSVSVQGRLQPAEMVDRGSALIRPSDTITAVNVNELAMRWSLPLLDGYVVLAPSITGSELTSPLILPPSGITWRNLFYAWQWWAFAVFVVFLLGRYVIDVRNEPPTLSTNFSTTREDQS